MAEDSPKEESKDNLKFFKKAKDQTEKPSRAEEDTEQEPEEEEEVPAASAESTPETAPDIPEHPVDTPRKVKRPGTPLSTLLAPTVALAVRTLVILAIIVADAYAAYFLVVKGIAPRMAEGQVVRAAGETSTEEEAAAEVEEVHAQGKGAPAVGSITPIEDIVVNPAGSSGTRYLCTTVALESTKPLVADEITTREPQIRDTLIEILSRRSVEELSALSTRDELRAEIKTAVNEMLTSGEVVGVYLSNFVLQ
jgi:flagellar FliL protein